MRINSMYFSHYIYTFLFVVIGTQTFAKYTKPGGQIQDGVSYQMPDDRKIQKDIEQAHQHLWKYFIHTDLHVIYDRIAPISQQNRWSFLPSPKDINEGKPNLCGWTTGMEDGALYGGAYLACLVWRFEKTKLPEHADDARIIYKGLYLLGTVSKVKGFIARNTLPDGKTFYPNSSIDQYTNYIVGLWIYYHSDIATQEEKGQIKTIIHDICTRIEKDNFEILSADGKIAQFCDVGSISADRASRLLSFFMVGYDITGDAHFLEIYQEKLQEKQYARLYQIISPEKLKPLMGYTLLQNQLSLIPLVKLESSLPMRIFYQEAMKVTAKTIEERLSGFKEYEPQKHSDNYNLEAWKTGGAVQKGWDNASHIMDPCQAMVVMLLAYDNTYNPSLQGFQDQQYYEYLQKYCRELISTYDYEKMRSCGFLYAEFAYWMGVKQNMFTFCR